MEVYNPEEAAEYLLKENELRVYRALDSPKGTDDLDKELENEKEGDIKRVLDRLAETGFLESQREFNGQNRKKTIYQRSEGEPTEIATEYLQRIIDNAGERSRTAARLYEKITCEEEPRALNPEKGHKAKDLAESLDTSYTWITGTLNKMDDQNLISNVEALENGQHLKIWYRDSSFKEEKAYNGDITGKEEVAVDEGFISKITESLEN